MEILAYTMSTITQELKIPVLIGYDQAQRRYVYRETPTSVFFPVDVLPGGRIGSLVSSIGDLELETNKRLGRTDLRLLVQTSAPPVVEVLRPSPEPVYLTEKELKRLPSGTTLVGQRFLVNETITLGIDLSNPDTAHVLVIGMTGSGKSNAMKTILTGLMYSTSPRDLRIYACDMKNRGLLFLKGSPHLEGDIVTKPEDVRDKIKTVYDILIERKDSEQSHPTIVLAIDELGEFNLQGLQDLMQKELVTIGRQGRELRVHLIVSVHKPDSATVGTDLLQQFGLRIAGRLRNARESTDVLGSSGLGAERLPGLGAMLFAKAGSDVKRFQTFLTETPIVQQTLAKWAPLSAPVVRPTKREAPPTAPVPLPEKPREAQEKPREAKSQLEIDVAALRPMIDEWYDFETKSMKRGGWSAVARAMGAEPGGSTDGRSRRAIEVLAKEKNREKGTADAV